MVFVLFYFISQIRNQFDLEIHDILANLNMLHHSMYFNLQPISIFLHSVDSFDWLYACQIDTGNILLNLCDTSTVITVVSVFRWQQSSATDFKVSKTGGSITNTDKNQIKFIASYFL